MKMSRSKSSNSKVVSDASGKNSGKRSSSCSPVSKSPSAHGDFISVGRKGRPIKKQAGGLRECKHCMKLVQVLPGKVDKETLRSSRFCHNPKKCQSDKSDGPIDPTSYNWDLFTCDHVCDLLRCETRCVWSGEPRKWEIVNNRYVETSRGVVDDPSSHKNPDALNKSYKDKIIPRSSKRTALVDQSLARSSAEEKGAHDAAQQREREGPSGHADDVPEPVKTTLVVNPWKLQGYTKAFDYAPVTKVEWLSKGLPLPPNYNVRDGGYVGVEICGMFRKLDGKPWPVDQYCLFHDGQEVITSTQCMTIYEVAGDPIGKLNILDKEFYANKSQLLLDCAHHALLKSDFTKVWDNTYLSNKIKKYFLTYHSNYNTIDRDIMTLINDDTFYASIVDHCDREQAKWESRLKLRVQSILNKKGKGEKFEDLITRKLNYVITVDDYGSPVLKIPKLSTYIPTLKASLRNAVVLTASTLAFMFIPGCIAKTVTGLTPAMLLDIRDRYTRIAAMRDVFDEVTSTKNYGVTPLSMSYIKKITISPERIDRPCEPTFKLKTDYTRMLDYDTKEEKVEIFGSVIEDAPMVYPTSGDQNLDAAMQIRMGFERTVDEDYLDGLVEFGKRFIDSMPNFHCEHRSDTEIFDELCLKYGKTIATNMISKLHNTLTLKDLVYKAFVKKEVYVGKKEENFKPRMIWSSPAIIIAKFSAYFSQISKHFNKQFSACDDIFYASSTSPYEVGMFGEKMADYPYLFESDVSSWDGSLVRSLIMLEKYYMSTKVTGMPVDFNFMLENWGLNKACSNSGGINVTLDYGRRSGDLWTSTFNSLINIIITLYIFKHERNELRIMVLGDDNMVSSTTAVDVDECVKNYAKLGMKCEIIQRDTLQEATFCSGRFWRVNGTYKWGNMPFRTLTKFGMNHGCHHKRDFPRLLYGTAKSMMSSASHVPILGAFMKAIVSSGKGQDLRPLYDKRNDNPHKITGGLVDEPDIDTYRQFEMLYGISMDEVMEIEDWLLHNIHIEDFPYLLNGAVFRDGFEIDTGVQCDGNDRLVWYTEPIEPITQHTDVERYRVTYLEPRVEEVLKIQGCRSTTEAFSRGWSYGYEEDELLGSISHAPLHAFLSTLSYWNLDWGVGLHRAYNTWAYDNGMDPANKRKAKNKNKQAKPKSNTRATVKSVVKAAVKSALMSAGGAIGTTIGGPSGGIVGTKAGALISRLIGSGDYKVSSNTIMSQGLTFGDDAREIRVRHHEYLGDISASTNFTVSSYPINPGLRTSFTWISQLTDAFQQYKLRGCVFYFRSTSAEWSGSGQALGTVIMGTQYDVTRPDFTSKREMENYMFSNSTKPSEHAMHPIECSRAETPISNLYIRTTPLTADQDPKFYDFANFQIAVVGCDSAVEGDIIGELWVAYDIELLKPQFPPGGAVVGDYLSWQGGAVSLTIPFGSSLNPLLNYGNLPLTITSSAQQGIITFPNTITGGRFFVSITWNALASGVWTAPASAVFTNCTRIDWMEVNGVAGRGTNQAILTTGVTVTRAFYNFVVDVDGYNAAGSNITINWSSIPIVGTTACQIDVICIPTTTLYL